MQIRYLEAMQAMAKSANSKVIFLPAQNETVQSALAHADAHADAPASHPTSSSSNPLGIQTDPAREYARSSPGFQGAINAHVIENM